MEEYSDIEIDTSDTCNVPHAPDMTPVTMQAPEHDQAQQMSHLGIEIEKTKAGKLGVLGRTSRNGAL